MPFEKSARWKPWRSFWIKILQKVRYRAFFVVACNWKENNDIQSDLRNIQTPNPACYLGYYREVALLFSNTTYLGIHFSLKWKHSKFLMPLWIFLQSRAKNWFPSVLSFFWVFLPISCQSKAGRAIIFWQVFKDLEEGFIFFLEWVAWFLGGLCWGGLFLPHGSPAPPSPTMVIPPQAFRRAHHEPGTGSSRRSGVRPFAGFQSQVLPSAAFAG